jgi:hypothetical protein
VFARFAQLAAATPFAPPRAVLAQLLRDFNEDEGLKSDMRYWAPLFDAVRGGSSGAAAAPTAAGAPVRAAHSDSHGRGERMAVVPPAALPNPSSTGVRARNAHTTMSSDSSSSSSSEEERVPRKKRRLPSRPPPLTLSIVRPKSHKKMRHAPSTSSVDFLQRFRETVEPHSGSGVQPARASASIRRFFEARVAMETTT